MPRRSKQDLSQIFIIMLIAVIFVGVVVYPEVFGLTSNQGSTLIAFLPSFAVLVSAVYVFKSARGVYWLGSFIMIGFGLCLFWAEADTQGLLVNSLLGDLTLAQLQTWTVAFFTLIGITAYGLKR